MQNKLEYKDNELHGLYEKYKYKSWVAYLCLLVGPDFALQRFYLGDNTSLQIAIYFIAVRVILFISLWLIFDLGASLTIDFFLIFIFMLCEIFLIPNTVKNNNFQLVKNLKKLEDIKFQNKQTFWNYFIPVLLILKLIIIFHPILEYKTLVSIMH